MNVCFILVTYNGMRDLPRFFSTLRSSGALSRAVLIIVDNASTDTTREYIREQCSEHNLIFNEENYGYARACNQGIQAARSRGADAVGVLNQDLSFVPLWLEPLVAVLERNPTCAAVQPVLFLDPERDKINSWGNALHYLGFGYTRGYRMTEEEWGAASAHPPFAYCSGAAVLFRLSALDRVGEFDEDFFMYHEDTDLCLRLQSAGYTIEVCPQGRVYHTYEFGRSIKKFYYMERNRLLCMAKHYPARLFFLIFPMFAFWEIGMCAYSLFGSLFGRHVFGVREKMYAYAYFLRPRVWSRIARQRCVMRGLRRCSGKDLLSLFSVEILFQDVSSPLLRHVANPLSRWYWRVVCRFI